MNKKIIIGIAGEIGAGKTTLSNYLKRKYQAKSFRFSDMLSDILERLYLEKNRPNLQKLSTLLRQNFSEEIMSKTLINDIKNSSENFIITEGIRRPGDVVHLKKMPNFYIIGIEADEKKRYERTIARTEKTDDQTKTREEFQAEGKQESEQKIKEIIKKADFIIDNNDSLENLYKKTDEIISQIK